MAIDQRLFGIYSLNFFINAANSILAPFYPDEAIKKGVTKDIIGFIFSSWKAAVIGGFLCFYHYVLAFEICFN